MTGTEEQRAPKSFPENSMRFRSRRMILNSSIRHDDALHAIQQIDPTSEGNRSESASRVTESFRLKGDAEIHLCHDFAANCRFIQAFGNSKESVLATTEAIERQLRVWSYSDLLEFFDTADGAEHRKTAVLRLGIGAPPAFDEDFFSRINECLKDPTPEVRKAGLTAVSFHSVGAFTPSLQQIAVDDPVPDLRETASIILDIFEERGMLA